MEKSVKLYNHNKMESILSIAALARTFPNSSWKTTIDSEGNKQDKVFYVIIEADGKTQIHVISMKYMDMFSIREKEEPCPSLVFNREIKEEKTKRDSQLCNEILRLMNKEEPNGRILRNGISSRKSFT